MLCWDIVREVRPSVKFYPLHYAMYVYKLGFWVRVQQWDGEGEGGLSAYHYGYGFQNVKDELLF